MIPAIAFMPTKDRVRSASPAVLLALLLLFALPCRAALSPNGEKLLDEGLTSLYGLDYEQSRSAFRKLIELEPDNPFGYLFESGAIWWQSSQEYGLFKDTPTLQGLFEQDVEAALRKSKPLLDSPDKAVRADAYFVSGMALGTRGQWGLLRGHWLQAYFDGKKAIKYLKKCLKIDPDYHDAYLGLGVFDYQAARLPAVIQFSPLVGVRGDEERGLERIHLAMDKGRYGSRQAAQLLVSIYIVDKHDYGRALTLVARLRKDFPQSPYFQFLEIVLRHRLGDWDGSLRESRDLFERTQAFPKEFDRKLLSLFCGLAAEKCFQEEDVARALVWLDHALESAGGGTPSAWLALLRLYRGQTLDILMKREEAVKEYKLVLSAADFSGFHARARRCLAQSCDAQSTIEHLRALSRGEP